LELFILQYQKQTRIANKREGQRSFDGNDNDRVMMGSNTNGALDTYKASVGKEQMRKKRLYEYHTNWGSTWPQENLHGWI
jgi:hypothetical protein